MFRIGQVWNRSFRRVTHRLDIVAVGIEHEGAVIIGVIVRANAGCTTGLFRSRPEVQPRSNSVLLRFRPISV